MSLIVRYLRSTDQMIEIVESFVGLNAAGLRDTIIDALTNLHINYKDGLIAQCYDGASVMSGCANGVQTLIINLVPCAHYVHCHAHRLNLVVVDVCKGTAKVCDMFTTLKSLYVVFFKCNSPQEVHRCTEGHYPNKRPLEIPSISNTRCICQHRICSTICQTMPAIIQALDDLSVMDGTERAASARGLMTRIESGFVIHLVVMKRILGLCAEVAEGLQSDNLIIDQAQEIVRGLKSALTVPMLPEPDDEWGKLYREANEVIEFCNLPNLPARTIRRARVDRVRAR